MTGYYDGGYYYEDDGDYERAPLTPDEIERQGFAIAHRGYDRDQVRGFLYEVAAALRLALQGNRSTVFGPPPTWSHGQPEYGGTPATPELTVDSTRILRAHLSASLRQDKDAEAIVERAREEAAAAIRVGQAEADKLRREAEGIVERARQEAQTTLRRARVDAEDLRREAEAIVERVRAEAEGTVTQAEAEADELRAQAEADAEAERERARRTLAAAQEEAQALVAEAEARARRVLKGARQDALNHAQQVSSTLEVRADQLVEAEQSTLQRLNETRRQLSKLIEDLAGAEPVIGPTIEILRLAVDARTTGEPSLAGPPVAATESDTETQAEAPAEHPVSTMVRAAVARAMDAATVDDDGEEPEEDVDLPEATGGTATGPYDLDLDLPPPPAAPGRLDRHRSSRERSGDLRDLLSELADIVAEDDEAPRGT